MLRCALCWSTCMSGVSAVSWRCSNNSYRPVSLMCVWLVCVFLLCSLIKWCQCCGNMQPMNILGWSQIRQQIQTMLADFYLLKAHTLITVGQTNRFTLFLSVHRSTKTSRSQQSVLDLMDISIKYQITRTVWSEIEKWLLGVWMAAWRLNK